MRVLFVEKGVSMAIGWLSVLKMVPWGEVIDNAPKVAHGAKKLWKSVGKKPAVDTSSTVVSHPLEEATTSLAGLQARVAALQEATAELHQQMQESSALIQSLAEQNTQLIGRVEVQRRRLLWLGLAWVAMAGVVATKLF
jgi:hypothetical protein